MSSQGRPDLEFLARMLGVKVIRGRWEGYPLADEVEIKMADPITNARARGRIAALFAELPDDPDEPNVDAPRALPAGRGLGLGRFSLC